MRATKLYPFFLAPNGSQNFLVEGDYFKIKSATGSVSVTGDTFGTIQNLLQGQGLRDTNFRRITITDETGSANAGYLQISDGTFVDDRITGEVSVIDGEKARTLAGGMYAACPALLSVASTYARVQLWNPVGSGKNVILTQADCVSTLAGNSIFAFSNVQLTTAYSFSSSNKRSGGSAPSALLRTQQDATQETTFANGILKNINLPANSSQTWQVKGALIISPGWGLNVYQNNIATDVKANFEWFEENVT